MSFIGSLEIIDVEGNSTKIRPVLADEIAWSKATKKSLTQLGDLDLQDLAILAHEASKRLGLTTEPLLEWAKTIDSVMPVGDFPKAMTQAPSNES